MKGKTIIVLGEKEHRLRDLYRLAIRDDDKLWVYEGNTDNKLWFKPAPMSGHATLGNYLKQWRLRQPDPDGKKKMTQKTAGKKLGVKQSMIAKMERCEREIPMKILNLIRKFNRATFGKE